MKTFKKSHLLFIVLVTLMLVLSGCNSDSKDQDKTDPTTESTTVPTTESVTGDLGKPIAFNTVYIDELPIKAKLEVESLIASRGYYRWTDEAGISYLLISSGEKPTGGYGIEVVSLGEYEGVYKVLVGEGKPSADAVVPQVITYPYVVITFEGDLEVTSVGNEMGEPFEAFKAPTVEILSIEGIYQGQIDNTSIEVKVGEGYMVFRNYDLTPILEGLATGDTVVIQYTVNAEEQNELVALQKK